MIHFVSIFCSAYFRAKANRSRGVLSRRLSPEATEIWIFAREGTNRRRVRTKQYVWEKRIAYDYER